MPRMSAALLGAREVGSPCIHEPVLVAVFIPSCRGGIVGLIFREFTVTLSYPS